jgi:protein RecA
MEKKKLVKEDQVVSTDVTGSGRYGLSAASSVKLFSSGSTLLNCALGGGWVLGRVGNIVGDNSTGKTLLCIEACANFAQTFKNSPILYREAESAFDDEYAETLGLPVSRMERNPGGLIDTVEDVFEEMKQFFAKAKKSKEGGLYILDSLDALTDNAEMERDFTENSFGTGKAKNMSKLFRMSIREMEESGSTCLFVSQTRCSLASFGQKWVVSGGEALKFYSSQRVILSGIGKIFKTVDNVEREVGVNIRAKVFKNKIGPPGREVEFPIRYGYGVNDVQSIVEWFEEIKRNDLLGIEQEEEEDKKKDEKKDKKKLSTKVLRKLVTLPFDEQDKIIDKLTSDAKKVWYDIEAKLVPERRKYA